MPNDNIRRKKIGLSFAPLIQNSSLGKTSVFRVRRRGESSLLPGTALHSASDLHARSASHFSARFTSPRCLLFAHRSFSCSSLRIPTHTHRILSFSPYPPTPARASLYFRARFFRPTHQRGEFERRRAFGLASALEGITGVRSNEPFSTALRATGPLPYALPPRKNPSDI